MNESLLHEVLFFLAAAVLVVPLFKRFGLGSVLGYLAAGLAIGPGGLGLIANVENVLHFAEIGVVMMLFLVGLELEPAKLWQMRRLLFGLGSAQLLLSAVGLSLVAFVMGLGQVAAVFVGLTLALSSTAFAMQLMAENNELTTNHGRSAIAVLLFQDLSVIFLLLALPLLAGTAETQDFAWRPVALAVVSIAALIGAGRYLMNPWLRWLAETHYRELMSASALLLVLGVAVLMEYIGLSMGLGAFLAGILLANSPFRHQLETDIEPFKGLLLGLFFIAIGMSLQLGLLVESPLVILGWVVALVVIKILILWGLGRVQGLSDRESWKLGILLSQGGEFAFVLLTQARVLNVVDELLVDQMTLIVGLSMATTPLMLKLIRPKAALKDNRPMDLSGAHDEPSVIIAGFGRFGQIIGRLLAVKGILFTALDKDARHVDFVTRFGNQVFYGDVSRLDLLHQAKVGKAKLVVLALDDVDCSLKAAQLLREHFPQVRVIARARNRHHALSLMAMGIPHVLRETFDASLMAAQMTLTELGMPEGVAIDAIKTFREFDERMLKDAVDVRDDWGKLMEIAHKGREELKNVFAKDHQG